MNSNLIKQSSALSAIYLAVLAGTFMTVSPALAARTEVAYIPGITLAPEVLQSDGTTPRTYQTPQGPVLWNENLPIQQGDKIKLDVFVATGGSDLADVKVRLDNSLIANIQTSPWNTMIDTSTLPLGYHMIEVWAQSTGNPPESSSKQLLFDVVAPVPVTATTEVKPSDQTYSNGAISSTTLSGNSLPPALPLFLEGKPIDPLAQVTLGYRYVSVSPQSPSTLVTTDPVTIDSPMLFSVHAAADSDARQFAYALVRDGVTILASAAPVSLNDARVKTVIKIQKRSDSQPGLQSGQVMMWVWGVDAQGQPGNPVKALLQIP